MAEAAELAEENQDQLNDAIQSEDLQTQAKSIELSEVDVAEVPGAGGGIEILLDMSILVTVSIGQMEIPVRRLLQLGPGSVLKLDKSIDEPADLYLRDTKFAIGNVVVVDDQFAVKIKQILGLGDSAADAVGV